jgi:putative transposase
LVDDPVQVMGISGTSESRVSKSQVSGRCAKIDEKVKAFMHRPIEGDWPYLYLWVDATYVKVAGIVSVAVFIAVGVDGDARREILGLDFCHSEAKTLSTGSPHKLAGRGMRGVKRVVSDL